MDTGFRVLHACANIATSTSLFWYDILLVLDDSYYLFRHSVLMAFAGVTEHLILLILRGDVLQCHIQGGNGPSILLVMVSDDR